MGAGDSTKVTESPDSVRGTGLALVNRLTQSTMRSTSPVRQSTAEQRAAENGAARRRALGARWGLGRYTAGYNAWRRIGAGAPGRPDRSAWRWASSAARRAGMPRVSATQKAAGPA